MERSIHIQLADSSKQADLVDFLQSRGLACSVSENGFTDIEVSYTTCETDRLRVDCWTALQVWLAEHELPLVPTPLGEDGYVLRPPGE